MLQTLRSDCYANPVENHTYTIERFGTEKEPVVVMDDFLPDSSALVELATQQSFGVSGPYYPGIRAPASVDHLAPAAARLEAVFRQVFGVTHGVRITESNFSLVTTPPAELKPIQCLPHYDGLQTGRFALLHYLADARFGGTSFYRHRSTGFETINEARFDQYRQLLTRHFDGHGPPPQRYFAAGDDQFERIGTIEAQVNRAIIYRGITLHSGEVPHLEGLSADPRQGRLTINTFFETLR